MNSGPALAQATHAGRVVVNDVADGVLDFQRAGDSVDRIQDALRDGNVYRALREGASILGRVGKYESAARENMQNRAPQPVYPPAQVSSSQIAQAPSQVPRHGSGGAGYQSSDDFRADFVLK